MFTSLIFQLIINREDSHEHQCHSYRSLLETRPNLPRLPALSSLNICVKEEVGCILFSSGTTGLPKAVMMSKIYSVTAILELK